MRQRDWWIGVGLVVVLILGVSAPVAAQRGTWETNRDVDEFTDRTTISVTGVGQNARLNSHLDLRELRPTRNRRDLHAVLAGVGGGVLPEWRRRFPVG